MTKEEHLKITIVFIEKWAELISKEIDADLSRLGEIGILDRFYKMARWKKLLAKLNEVYTEPTQDEDEKWSLIFEMYGDDFDFLPSSACKPDVKSRLNWLKQRVAKDFELEFQRIINEKSVSSPIEQIFLMEWRFADIDRKHKVRLCPHESIGKHEVDFLVVPDGTTPERSKVAIELDGHDFHEKSKDQVRKDKARERAIVFEGIHVLRFSGSEIVRNARGCVEEVVQFLKKWEF